MRVYDFQTRVQQAKKASFWKKQRSKFKWNTKTILTWMFRLTSLGVLLVAILFLYYMKDLPDPSKLLDRNVPESTKIFARDGSLLYEIHGEFKRTRVELSDVNDNIRNATVAIEDKDFYKHRGISFKGIARALLRDVTTGDFSQGGSTITQQFVKNAILTREKSPDRKIKEAILAIAIEARFSKEQILQFYLNEIPYGRNAYGIQAAAETYLGKSAKDLSVAESAYLAALPQSPTRYNPFGPNRTLLDARKDAVLQAMKDQGYITEEQRNEASGQKVEFTTVKTAITAPHFTLYVQDYLAKKFGEKSLQEGGLKVYTTLDPKLQEIAERAVREGAEKNVKNWKAHNAALVAIDPKTGQILAMVGSKDYFGETEPEGCAQKCLFDPNVNVATSEPGRQPGSSFKPYAYVTAFKPEFKFSPASMLIDVVTNFGTFGGKAYIPHNYNGREYGPVSMRQALAGSLNIPAVKTLDLVGVPNVTQTARDLGITSPMADCGLSLVLGGCEVKLVDHVAAFSVFANEGKKNEKTPILKIEDRDGKLIEEYKADPKEAVNPEAVYELVSIMTDNEARTFIFGPNSPLTLPNRPVAAKTGTTNDWKDGWTLGFTPQIAAGVWAGNNNGTLMKAGADGSYVAAPIWNQFMREAHKDLPVEQFPRPEGIKEARVAIPTGKLPTEYTESTKNEIFASYAVPTESDDMYINVAIDILTGLPADPLTPPDRISYQIAKTLHSEKKDNAGWEEPVVRWALANGYSYPSRLTDVKPDNTGAGPDITVLQPQEGSAISYSPFTVNVAVNSQSPVVRVDLTIDGQYYKNLTSSPYIFQIDKQLADGPHKLAIRAVDSSGSYSDTSVNIRMALNTPLSLTDPGENENLNFPTTLVAESSLSYDSVIFFYQTESGSVHAIGPSSNVSHPNNYRYTVEWSNKPEPGTYRVYAQTNSGIITPKVRITVP
jgi:1A family penicillin-binding protein